MSWLLCHRHWSPCHRCNEVLLKTEETKSYVNHWLHLGAAPKSYSLVSSSVCEDENELVWQ